jgi:GTPase SAR1 family protein
MTFLLTRPPAFGIFWVHKNIIRIFKLLPNCCCRVDSMRTGRAFCCNRIDRRNREGELLEHAIINETYERYRAAVISWLNDLFKFTTTLEDEGLSAVVDTIRHHVSEPFLFVVVGEIKAGKSSFINALLSTDICRVDPAPCTDSIQQIVFSPEKTETEIAPHHWRIGLPAEVLRHVSIVDTPGTNTVIEHHHEITEQYIPNSGLVLFVFPAKNPHTRTAWELLDYISAEWRKRVVFVLQQADLATENELTVNIAKVEEYAGKRGIEKPLIFATSARWEQEKNPGSGFDPIRAYIRETVTGGRHLYLKLSTTLASAGQVLKKVHDALQGARTQLEADRGIAALLLETLETGKGNIEHDITQFVEALITRYDRIGLEIRSDFEEGLSVVALYTRAIRGTLNRKKSVSVWLEELQLRFETRLTAALADAANEGAWQFMQTIQALVDRIDAALERAVSFSRSAGQEAPWDKRRAEIVEEIRQRVGSMAATDLFHETLVANPGAMPSRLMSGGTLALIGTILLASTHVTLLDITGGALAGLGLFITGGVLIAKRGKILREFNQAVAGGREKLKENLTGQLTARFSQLHSDISRNVQPFLNHITEREMRLSSLMARGENIQREMIALSGRIEADMGEK